MDKPQSPPAGDTVDLILDRFSKAHPFADTRAYNVFHKEAKARVNAYILAQIKELIDHAAVDMTMPAEYILGQTELATQLRHAAQARFGNQQGDN